jgi:hypothetical protein
MKIFIKINLKIFFLLFEKYLKVVFNQFKNRQKNQKDGGGKNFPSKHCFPILKN